MGLSACRLLEEVHSLSLRAVAQGKYVILFFYPLDFTFVCPTEITAFSDKHAEFAKINTEVRQSCGWSWSGQGTCIGCTATHCK